MWEVVIGGALAIAGGVLAQWWQSARAREEARNRLKAEKAARLRAAYSEIVASADHMRGHAQQLWILEFAARRSPEHWPEFVDKMAETPLPISEARTALFLEADEADRAALTELQSVSALHLAFLASVANHVKEGGEIESETFEEQVRAIEAGLERVAKVARDRLAALEKSILGRLSAEQRRRRSRRLREKS